jgi:hypothetical protein
MKRIDAKAFIMQSSLRSCSRPWSSDNSLRCQRAEAPGLEQQLLKGSLYQAGQLCNAV